MSESGESARELLRLGERYAALGLSAAASACFERSASADGETAVPLRRLVEVALASGRPREARAFAAELARRDKSLGARLLTGQTQLAVGELAGARFSFAAVVDSARATALERARAMVGRAQVAEAEGDRPGASANIMGAIEVLARWSSDTATTGEDLDREHLFIDEVVRLAVAWDRTADVGQIVAGLERAAVASPGALWRASWLIARQSHGDAQASDRDIEAALEAELAVRPQSRGVRFRRCERMVRRRSRGVGGREQAIAQLEALIEELSEQPGVGAELARVLFLLAAAHEDDPATRDRAAEAYQRGLALRPSYTTAATRLADLYMSRGDAARAVAAAELALRTDPDHPGAWVCAVRVGQASAALGSQITGRLLEAATPGAGIFEGTATRLAGASAAVARDDVLAGVFARGHRLKNLLGIVGVRARSLRKLAEGDLGARLSDLETALSALYDEWGTYLRSMHSETNIETVAVAPLVREVAQAGREAGDVAIEVDIAGAPPDLTGDRLLLREALTNVIVNAVQACKGGGAVKVLVRPRPGSTPAVEIRIEDSGSGIPAAVLSRVFSPGFTTKDLGSGVGLAVAERVVSAHNGRILIDSEEGRGTTVTVILPCELAALSPYSAF